MKDSGPAFVTPDQLRKGLYIELDLGWMSHPFPKGSFKITTSRQIETLRELGLQRIRYLPAKSDPPPRADANGEATTGFGEKDGKGTGADAEADAEADADAVADANPDADADADRPVRSLAGATGAAAGVAATTDPEPVRQEPQPATLLEAQQRSLDYCEEQFALAMASYQALEEQLGATPDAAAGQCRQMVDALVRDLLGQRESSIRLLSEGMGDRAAMHPVNVTVLCLLLGKALKMPFEPLRDLGMAALLHDIGKSQLPERMRWLEESFSPEQLRQYRSHVAHGVLISRKLSLSPAILSAIAQHHEYSDGSGFPRQTRNDSISLGGKVLALVNLYENMCNPYRPSAAVTPHEALSLIFAQMRMRFDPTVLGAFIRMMGVYPPGSVVQLSDNRHALVVSVNSDRPLKPQVLVHEPSIPSSQALVVNLENVGSPGIRRSVRPAALPRAAIDYLSPRARICYFFERAVEPASAGVAQ